MLLTRLVVSNLSARRVRASLTVAAIALSVSLVVAVTTGYASSLGAASKYLSLYMGAADLTVSRAKGDPHGTFPQSVADELRTDARVTSALARFETASTVLDEQGHKIPGRPIELIGIRRPADRLVESLKLEAGEWFEATRGEVVVIDQILAQRLKVKVGGTFRLAGQDRPMTVKVVGIVHKPNILAADQQTAYLPLETLQGFMDRAGRINRVMLTLKRGTDAEAFKREWLPRVEKADPLLTMKSAGDMRKQMETNLQGLQFLSYLGGTVSMVSATFIVFSALSMGVNERQRTLAMLRAIGAFKKQLAALVVIEGMILALLGVAVGVPLGLLWVKMLATWKPDFFTAGVVVDWVGVTYGSVGSVLTALVASLLPAWSAGRVDPLEAMTPLAKPTSSRPPIVATLAGLVLVAIDPVLIYSNASRDLKFFGHLLVGLPALMVGFFLLAPLFVWTFERVGGRLLAVLMGVRPALLRQQLSSGIWRAAGTAAALMVGLAILVVMQVQGHSVMQSWRLPDRFPDIFIVSFDGISPAQQRKLQDTPGIRKGELMPVAIGTAVVSGENLDVGGANVIPQAAMFFGVDPDKAPQMLELEFRDDRGKTAPRDEQPRLNREAAEALKKGRHVIITDEYFRLLGKKRGDTLMIDTPMHGKVAYTIAGVVWSPGIDVIVSMFDMERQFDQRTATSMFGSLADARNDFGINDVTLFAANLDLGVDKKQLVADMEKGAGTGSAAPPPATAPAGSGSGFLSGAKKLLGLGGATQPSTQPGGERAAAFTGLKQFLGMSGMQAGDVRQIKHAIQQGFGRLLLVLSSVAFASMGVAALGVTNTIMASVRSRQWQFGVLRSVGVTRSQLLRLVLAEALLLGLTGCALGLACGFVMSFCENGMSTFILGHKMEMAAPWRIIFVGVGAVMFTAVAASLWPAMGVAREEPLALLQAGRAAA